MDDLEFDDICEKSNTCDFFATLSNDLSSAIKIEDKLLTLFNKIIGKGLTCQVFYDEFNLYAFSPDDAAILLVRDGCTKTYEFSSEADSIYVCAVDYVGNNELFQLLGDVN